MLPGWIAAWGVAAEYEARIVELLPADELLGRAAKTEVQWESLRILIDIHGPVERLAGSSREEVEQLAFYSDLEIPAGRHLRYGGREYAITLAWPCPVYGEDCWRYESAALVKR